MSRIVKMQKKGLIFGGKKKRPRKVRKNNQEKKNFADAGLGAK